MHDFRGSVAGQLPRKQSNVFCFQYVTPWQWQAVAGLCHARKGLKTKRKSVVVADAWQGSTNVLSAALLPQRGGVVRASSTDKNLKVKKHKDLGQHLGEEFPDRPRPSELLSSAHTTWTGGR
jgi:hypothetical protein